MGVPMHTVEVPNGLTGFAYTDRVLMGTLSMPYGAGSGAGASVTVTAPDGLALPPTAMFFFAQTADVTAYTAGNSGGTATFTVEPRNPANTLAAGTLTVLVVA